MPRRLPPMAYSDFFKGADSKYPGKLSLTVQLCARRKDGRCEIHKVNGALEIQIMISQRNEIVDLNFSMRATCFAQENHAARR